MVQMEKENENNAKEILLLNNEITILKEKLGKADTVSILPFIYFLTNKIA